MTPDQELRVLEMLKDHEEDRVVRQRVVKFWATVAVFAKALAAVGAAVAAVKYMGDTVRALLR